MAEVSPGSTYPELLRVTGPLLSLVFQAEDVWQRYNQYTETFRDSQIESLNQGFPFSPLQRRQDRTRMDTGVDAKKCVCFM